MRKPLLIAVFAAVLVATAAPAGAAPPVAGADQTWIVTLDPGTPAAEHAGRLVGPLGGTVGHIYEYVLNGFAFRGSEQAARALERNPNVLRVEAARPVRMVGESASNGFFRIDADDTYLAGDRGKMADGTPVRVAVLDTGVDVDHMDLAPSLDLASSISCIAAEPSLQDGQGHGTHVAGIAAAANQGDGMVGVASEATIVSAKVLDATGYGTDAEVICGLDHVAALHAADGIPTVVNLSLGEAHTAESGCASSGMHQAICNLTDAGVTVVAAAGNSAADSTDSFYPAAYPETIAVSAFAALDTTPGSDGCSFFIDTLSYECDDELASFTNYGSVIDVTAPGVRVQSTTFDGGWGLNSGTSMAAPFATGVAALVLAADPTLSPNAVRSIMQTTGECPDGSTAGAATCAGHGEWLVGSLFGTSPDPDGIPEPLIDAKAAVAAAAGNQQADSDPPVVTLVTPPDGASYTVGDLVIADYSCSDTGSGIVSCAGDVPDGTPIDTATTGAKTFSVTGEDAAGNVTTVTHSYTVGTPADTTPPLVTIASPIDGGSYEAGIDVVTAAYACSDSQSGVATCVGDLPDGAVLDTSAPVTAATFTVVATDNAGNEAAATSTYAVVDTTAPVITLLGDDPLVVLLGQPFEDPGAEVTDNVDPTVVITSDSVVDTDVPGDSTITYDSTDAAGNAAATVERVVTVVASAIDVATAEATTYGAATGDFTATHDADGSAEVLTETQSGGKPSKRTYRLEHTWTIPFSGGDGTVEVLAAASGETFAFEYSFNGSTWHSMTTIADGASGFSFTLPAGQPAGDLYVRVVDTDRTAGDTSPSSIAIDHLVVESEQSTGQPDLVLEATTGRAGASTVVSLSWTEVGALPYTVWRVGDGVIATVFGWAYVDDLGKKPSGTFTYWVCDLAATCSNEVTLEF